MCLSSATTSDSRYAGLSSLALLDRAAELPADEHLFALLRRIDPTDPDPAAQIRLAAQWARLESAAFGCKLMAVAAVDAAGADPNEAVDFRDEEISAALRVGRDSARSTRAVASTLATKGRLVLAALRAGELGFGHASQYAEALSDCSPAQALRVQELTLEKAVGLTPGRLRRLLRRTVIRVGAADFAKRHKEQKKDVHVSTFFDDRDGMAVMSARMTALDAKMVDNADEAWARAAKAGGDPRPINALRVAALVEMSQRYLTAPNAPRAHGRPITVDVTIDLTTYLGLTDHPGEILGTGAMIPAHALRDLIPQAALRRIITDPMTGELLDYGRTTYRFPADLAGYLIAKWVTSTGPGSTVPADRGDLDHAKPWDDHGLTDRDNGNPCNRRWHRAKTIGGWTVRQTNDGCWEWTSPLGLTDKTAPHDYRLGP